MSALFLDGFDHYGPEEVGAANMLQGAYAQVGSAGGPQTPAWGARTGEYCLAGNLQGLSARWVLPGERDHVFLSCGFSCDGIPSEDLHNKIVSFMTSSNDEIITVWVQANGSIVVTRAGVVIASTQGPVVVSRNWHFLEMEFDRSTGTYVLRIDDPTGAATPVIDETGLSVGSDDVGQVQLMGAAIDATGRVPTYMDDLFIRDDQGAENNDWCGDRRIATLLPTADTTTAGWAPRYYHNIGAGILDNTANNACVSAATATNLNIGSGDFTLEGFTRFQSLPGVGEQATIFSRWDETNNRRSYQLALTEAGNLVFQYSTDGTNATVVQPIVYPWELELNTWYHIAVVRASGQDLLFVNGEQLGLPIADSATYFVGTAPFALGGQVEGTTSVISTKNLTGWFDECRFTVGYARYTANFTPTTVAFPRGVSDPQWANVALLAGFDSVIQDESSYARTLTARNGAIQFEPDDGPDLGVYTTVNKGDPDDNTFMEAAYLPATNILTLSAQPANNDTVTVGTKDGVVAAVYRFRTVLASAFDVLIDSSLQQTLQNLYNAINAGAGVGTKYGAATTANVDVTASQLPAGQMLVTANVLGTAGNAITASVSLTNGGGWADATLTGGTNIPGPTNFKIARPPAFTTIVSAVQISFRGFKSDAGLATVNSALVGALGGVSTGDTHSLNVSPDYFSDIYEVDPDTAGPISPSTLINGQVQLNRAT